MKGDEHSMSMILYKHTNTSKSDVFVKVREKKVYFFAVTILIASSSVSSLGAYPFGIA